MDLVRFLGFWEAPPVDLFRLAPCMICLASTAFGDAGALMPSVLDAST